jgi:mono/diheme cytochrome c family protein
MMRVAVVLGGAVGLVVVVVVAACATARRGEPFGPEPVLETAAEVRGERVFAMHCDQCHPGGEAGLGPAINDRPLPGIAIKTQVRAGVGAMPAFSDDVLGDGDLDALTEYILALRRAPH